MILKRLTLVSFAFLQTFSFSSHQANALLGKEECFQPGECKESFLFGRYVAADEFECLQYCKAEVDCAWFTFRPETPGICHLFRDCKTLDAEDCPDCLSGQQECIPDDPVCFVAGECEGIVLDIESSPSQDGCLDLCVSQAGCRWFTFYEIGSECILFKNCATLDQSCQECVSGERRCSQATTTIATTTTITTTTDETTTPKPERLTKLLVANGFTFGGYLRSVEVINLDESTQDLTCDNLPDTPYGVEGPSGRLFQNVPILCGGFFGVARYDCYGLKNRIWTNISDLNEPREFGSATVISVPDDKEYLLVTGGAFSQPVEAFDGKKWDEDRFAAAPGSVNSHCTVKINETTLLLIGGYVLEEGSTSDRTHFFHIPDNRWIPGPRMNFPRRYHACGVMRWQNALSGNYESVVVVAGGDSSSNSDLLDSVELLFLEQANKDDEFLIGDEIGFFRQGWTMGPSLPDVANGPKMVEFENSVILVGGTEGLDGIHLYQLSSPVDGTWYSFQNQTVLFDHS